MKYCKIKQNIYQNSQKFVNIVKKGLIELKCRKMNQTYFTCERIGSNVVKWGIRNIKNC